MPELDGGYKTTFHRLARIFRSRGFTGQEADELAQEAIARTLSHLDRHGRRGDDLSPLLNTIAKNLVVERFRTGGREVPIEIDARLSDDVPDPADIVTRRDRARRLRRALDDLPERQRRAMLMTLEGLAPAEIARELGVKRNAADAILHRARRQLATRLREHKDGLWGAATLLGFRARNAARKLAGWANVADTGAACGQALTGIALAVVLAVAPSIDGARSSTTSGAGEPAAVVAGSSRSSSRSTERSPALRRSSVLGERSVRRDEHVDVDLRDHRAAVKTNTVNPTTGEKQPLGIEVFDREEGPSITGWVVDTAVDGICTGSPELCEEG